MDTRGWGRHPASSWRCPCSPHVPHGHSVSAGTMCGARPSASARCGLVCNSQRPAPSFLSPAIVAAPCSPLRPKPAAPAPTARPGPGTWRRGTTCGASAPLGWPVAVLHATGNLSLVALSFLTLKFTVPCFLMLCDRDAQGVRSLNPFKTAIKWK